MAYHFVDNIYSKSLTPKEPNIELLDAACERNIIVCLSNSSGKTFIASKLTQDIIQKAEANEGTITMYVADSPSVVSKQAACFQRLTDIKINEYHSTDQLKMGKIVKKPKVDQIFILETQTAIFLIQNNLLVMSEINLLILHDCHCILKSDMVPIKELMKYYFESPKKPHILSLASSLFSSELDLSQIKSSLNKMEDLLDCKAETASTVLSLLRYGTHPNEVMIEYGPHQPSSIDEIIRNEIMSALNFIRDHRYDPLEMYEGFTEELQNIPDPKLDPEEIFLELLNILDTLGPWSTDRAALVLLLQLEKLKVTTPYERHFLLLCMTSSVLIKIRAILDDFFKNISEKDRIYKFSSPKILRIIEILGKFVPEKVKSDADEYSDEEKEFTELDCKQSVEVKEFETESNQNSAESEDPYNFIDIIGLKRECTNCDCELMTEFLVKRLQHTVLDNVTFEQFVELVKSKSLEIKNNKLPDNGNQFNVISLYDNFKQHCLKNSTDKNSVISDKLIKCDDSASQSVNQSITNFTNHNSYPNKLKGKTTNIFQSKNGYLPMPDGEKLRLTNKSHSQEYKINEINTLENYLQYHEYLLLPKFKVDKHTRYDQFNMSHHFKSEGQDEFVFKQIKNYGDLDVQLCGLIFVEKKFMAKVLFHVLNDLKQADEDFSFLNVQFIVDKIVDGTKDPKGAENEHRKQELMLKRFRIRACNLLIGTSFLEEGIDLPKCNLVIRFDVPKNYRSYINTKERARATDSLYCLMVDAHCREAFINNLGKYYETEAMLLEKCGHLEPPEEEEKEADNYTQLIQPFCPLLKQDCPHVDLSSAIALVNRYCAKLPSDTFTRLTPTWNIKTLNKFGRNMFLCNIRLPINSPVKQKIEGCPMPTRVLARRFAAFRCCQMLHLSGELDDTLQPISKESFWMREEEQLTYANEELEEMIPKNSLEPRPGTTKRRQYYYKRIADSLTDCLPIAGEPSFLYDISMALTCPLPEEQNTRGRKIHPPEDSFQGFGILTRKSIPKIGPFPIFTRSGEVEVKLQLAQSTVVLSEFQIQKIVAFIHYTFTSVLRLQKYLMMFDPNASENSYFIVPTKKGKNLETIEVDWDFLELIFEKRNQVPVFISEEERKKFVFDPSKFEDAVVSPWYRNQDQPQYLYVAEICTNLNPKSAFPGTEYETFEEYYLKKYNIVIQNCNQALLDVDHTSARLNFLTPRYVNRKGVALPTASEEKKRAKRENLKQKQILVPELCDIHPFPATLWRKAVCLPCILHRINALLLADQVRRIVAAEIGIGSTDLNKDFNWDPLNFGWSLADVLKQTKALQQQKEEVLEVKKENEPVKEIVSKETNESKNDINKYINCNVNKNHSNLNAKDEIDEPIDKSAPWIEIGTWSNDMANKSENNGSVEELDEIEDLILPKNVTMIKEADINDINGWDPEISNELKESVRYCSPTSWLGEPKMNDENLTDCSSESSYSDDYLETSSASDDDSACGGLKIEFKEDNVAEAIESNHTATSFLKVSEEVEEDQSWFYEESKKYSKYVDEFNANLEKRKESILKSDKFFNKDMQFEFTRTCKNSKRLNTILGKIVPTDCVLENKEVFGSADNSFPRVVEEIPNELKNLPYTDVIIESLNDTETEQQNKFEKPQESVNKKLFSQYESFKELDEICKHFSFDEQPDLNGHPGPSPSLILQALTMSNANDGINLERLETIGDSFLKYAITTYLYCVYENVHEGKLSHLRSKQVSNFNLYRLGRRKVLGESMVATKFEPHDNWLPPCYYVPRELERALIEAGVPASHWNRADLPSLRNLTKEEICQLVREKGEKLGIVNSDKGTPNTTIPCLNLENMPCFIPYNLMTQHSIPDKSIADCVEALIGAYLVACGPRGALLFMSWLGIKVLPKEEKFFKCKDDPNIRKGIGCSTPIKVMTNEGEVWSQVCFGELQSPKQPLIRHVENPEGELERLLRGFEVFENSIKYQFRDRSYLLQALTHASYSPNRLTDCYQRLEFLGDAVLDYLITRHLYEDSRHHSPGALTDLRSALVNNTIFASLAVRHNFHKYFRHLCPSLNEVVDRFVRFQQENGHSITEEFYLIEEEECEEAEDVEVPKALGDVFESVAGAIFLDSGMSLDAVWKVYYRIMKNEIELFSTNVPKSPIRELFELEPETAQFGKPEKLADGRRVRVTVEVFGKGLFNGIGRNYRIAKCTAAKCALKQLKRKGLLERRK